MYIDDRRRLARLLGTAPDHATRIEASSGNWPDVCVRFLPFRSRSFRVLANVADLRSDDGLRDIAVRENRSFSYPVFAPSGASENSGAILLFHGLNEKSWAKYFPWAMRLCALTGRTVVLFPLAFHMNRAPEGWSDPRRMMTLSHERRHLYAPTHSSFANAALSARLQERPERFLWSGLQSYNDVIDLIAEIRTGRHPVIREGARIDLFGYSIGAFLAELLMLDNRSGLFSESRAFLFCGGSTLSAMAPVSKYIMDSAANDALASYYGEGFEAEVATSAPIARLFARIQNLGTSFLSMLILDRLKEFRVSRIAELGRRLAAFVLKSDLVISSAAVAQTLAPADTRANSSLFIEEFSFPYTHEEPFPLLDNARGAVDAAFNQVMDSAADFYA
ncbi:MAG TPA: DUF6051 family protein [Spirochaetia bacterium]|nr:DUF6051 family protein [Spirochaetia bacterium]